MKKVLAVCAAAAILCACGCGKQTNKPAAAQESTDAAAVIEMTEPQFDDDVALPAVNESGSTTAPVVANTTQPATFVQSAALQALEQAQNAPQTTAPAATTTTAPPAEPTTTPDNPSPSEPAQQPAEPTTEKPTEPTTESPKTAELLQSAVLAPINSGTYTMTISAFGKDHSEDDKLMKIVRGGETAYWITIPAAQLTYRVFPSGGKYYIATPTRYCELTKAQYDTVCKSFNNAFCNFSALKYQKTETQRDGLKKYTCEYFDLSGNELVLWYQNGKLTKLAVAGESLPMTVSGGADSSYFALDDSLEKVDYATLESLVSLAGAFFG